MEGLPAALRLFAGFDFLLFDRRVDVTANSDNRIYKKYIISACADIQDGNQKRRGNKKIYTYIYAFFFTFGYTRGGQKR